MREPYAGAGTCGQVYRGGIRDVQYIDCAAVTNARRPLMLEPEATATGLPGNKKPSSFGRGLLIFDNVLFSDFQAWDPGID